MDISFVNQCLTLVIEIGDFSVVIAAIGELVANPLGLIHFFRLHPFDNEM